MFWSCNKPDTLFVSRSPSSTNIKFQNTLEKKDLFGILYYLYYYNGGGVSIGDINNDGLPDIYFTANSYGGNKLYLNKGDLKFEDITEKAGVEGLADWCSGVTMADVNGDGFLDIYVCAVSKHHGLNGKNQLYINNHDQTFTERGAKYGLDFSGFGTQAVFFDYDHDGDLDCYLLNQSQKPNENIVDTSRRKIYDQFAGDRFYRNDLNGSAQRFIDISAQAGIYQSNLGYGLGIAVSDINNDGWDDIYIGNDFHENDYYYVNNGNGSFTEQGAKYFDHYSRFSMGNDVADYNNDGQLDVVTVDMLPPDEKVLKTYGSDEHADIYKFKLLKNGFQYQYSKNCLQLNNGNGSSFSETALLSGVSNTDWSWAPLFADFDNDGNKDLFISSGIVKRPVDLDYIRFVSNLYVHKGMNQTDKYDDDALNKMPDGSSHPFLYKGNGAFDFKDVSNQWGTGNMKGYFNGAAYADLDNDGDLDLVMNCLNAPAMVLENTVAKKNYLALSFNGDSDNKFGIGAKAYVFQNGKMQYQELMLTRGFQSSSDTRLHFGFDAVATIDSLLVVWPSQRYQVIKKPAINKTLVCNEKDATPGFDYKVWFPGTSPLLNEISAISWSHRENNFDDFNNQYLIPHAESTRGPKIAVGDVNGDGLDDLYACGAHSQSGSLLIQQSDNSFTASDTALFNRDAAFEDVDAIFFDANGDGSLDLYVVSGGNEVSGKSPYLADRLYLNNSKGKFLKSTDALPAIPENKSCVTAVDVDKDGDIDLFVGTLASASAYGVPQTSSLLINDGKGQFKLADKNIIDLDKIGMVTAAGFSDLDKDGWPDLVVTGEFMQMIIYMNKAGRFTKKTIDRSTGLWQSVFMDDVNGDGNMDILAGNWGWNNKFYSNKNGPLRMYVSDFDKNGKTDQLLSYTLNGTEYPFLAKDEVERPLPLLKKHYLEYAEYAGVAMKDVFYGWIDTLLPAMAEQLGSAVFYGDGKGGFVMQSLPPGLQMAPVFAFQKISEGSSGNNYIAAGNFFDVIPYEGRYDAQPLAMFTIDNNNRVTAIQQTNLAAQDGAFRDLKWIKTKDHASMLIAARNNGAPAIFLPAKPMIAK